MNDNHLHIGIAGTGQITRRGTYLADTADVAISPILEHAIEAEVVRTLARKARKPSYCHTCILRKDETNCKNCNRK